MWGERKAEAGGPQAGEGCRCSLSQGDRRSKRCDTEGGGHADLQHPRQRPEGAVQLLPEPGLLLGRGFWQEVATKVHLVKAMVFPVVRYGCESWTVKKAERRRIDGGLQSRGSLRVGHD